MTCDSKKFFSIANHVVSIKMYLIIYSFLRERKYQSKRQKHKVKLSRPNIINILLGGCHCHNSSSEVKNKIYGSFKSRIFFCRRISTVVPTDKNKNETTVHNCQCIFMHERVIHFFRSVS